MLAFCIEILRGSSTLVVDALAITALQRAVAPELVARVFGVFFALILAAVTLGAWWHRAAAHDRPAHDALRGRIRARAAGAARVPVAACGWTARPPRESRRLAPRIALLERLGIFEAARRAVLERLAGGTHRDRG